jgi:hypothetical protein
MAKDVPERPGIRRLTMKVTRSLASYKGLAFALV